MHHPHRERACIIKLQWKISKTHLIYIPKRSPEVQDTDGLKPELNAAIAKGRGMKARTATPVEKVFCNVSFLPMISTGPALL